MGGRSPWPSTHQGGAPYGPRAARRAREGEWGRARAINCRAREGHHEPGKNAADHEVEQVEADHLTRGTLMPKTEEVAEHVDHSPCSTCSRPRRLRSSRYRPMTTSTTGLPQPV